jgi:XTP/dITP diphosphohydrolase
VTGRVVLLVTSPRVPAGLLSWSAWEALRSAPVQTGDPDHPQLPSLRAAGIDVTVVDVPDAQALLDRAHRGESVVFLVTGENDADLVRDVAARDGVEVVHGSHDPPGSRLLDVVAVMGRLRSPGGCPWDADQTHTSLAPYLLEEAYEAYATLEDGDLVGLREELGDVLLQVAFHARLAQEAPEPWSIDDVAGDLVDKLVRRHPHVFAGADATDVERSWDAIKAQEKGGSTSVTDGVPLSQPALSLALKLQKRAGRLGAPLHPPARAGDPLGVELWELVRRCREQRIDPEAALRSVARAFRDRLAQSEAAVRRAGGDPAGLTQQQWSELWASGTPPTTRLMP